MQCRLRRALLLLKPVGKTKVGAGGVARIATAKTKLTETRAFIMLHTINRFVETYGRRSLDECLACFKQSDQTVAFGTAADEKRIGLAAIRAQLERDWSQSTAASLDMTWHKAVTQGETGWVAAEFAFRFKTSGEDGAMPVRATFVLEQDAGGNWVIALMHFSTADGNTEAGRSFN